jgi:hypothetical protein
MPNQIGKRSKKNTELIGDIEADESTPRLYGASLYRDNEIITHIKFGVVISMKGALRIHDIKVGFGISVIPADKLLFTYKGGSPKYFPFIIPNIFCILQLLLINYI